MGMPRLFLSSVFSVAVTGQTQLVVHPSPQLPKQWVPSNAAVPDDELLTLRFSLRENNLEQLREIALQVSDPKAPNYGQHLSTQELHNLTKPSDDDVDVFQSWLRAHEVYPVRSGSNSFEVAVTVTKANALLSSEFYKVAHQETDQEAWRASDYTLPEDVDNVVTALFGVHGLPLQVPRFRPLEGHPVPPAVVTPSVLAQTYGVSGVSPSGSTKHRQAVAEFLGQDMNTADLKTFFDRYVEGSHTSSVHKFFGDSSTGHTHGDTEASLDVQYIMGAAPGVLTDFWYYHNSDFCGELVKWTDALVSGNDVAMVHSVSYGGQGPLEDTGCVQGQYNQIDSNFAKLAAKGMSILISSGDAGSGYSAMGGCGDNVFLSDTAVEGNVYMNINMPDESFCCKEADFYSGVKEIEAWTFTPGSPYGVCSLYSKMTSTKAAKGVIAGGPFTAEPKVFPSWPASSPWVTAVGATRFVDNKVGGQEMASDGFGSGGGFSDMYGAFKDQKAAVQHYFQTVQASELPPSIAFDQQGRATPDISALGEGYQVVVNGQIQSVGGTSASTPAFAGFVSLLNEARARAGKPAMGYLNPFLYQNADAIRDVVVGTNAISRAGGTLKYGWPCAKGWDPATGLGTPDFQKLLNRAMSVRDAANATIVV